VTRRAIDFIYAAVLSRHKKPTAAIPGQPGRYYSAGYYTAHYFGPRYYQ
jgi:hypothetical protein